MESCSIGNAVTKDEGEEGLDTTSTSEMFVNAHRMMTDNFTPMESVSSTKKTNPLKVVGQWVEQWASKTVKPGAKGIVGRVLDFATADKEGPLMSMLSMITLGMRTIGNKDLPMDLSVGPKEMRGKLFPTFSVTAFKETAHARLSIQEPFLYTSDMIHPNSIVIPQLDSGKISAQERAGGYLAVPGLVMRAYWMGGNIKPTTASKFIIVNKKRHVPVAMPFTIALGRECAPIGPLFVDNNLFNAFLNGEGGTLGLFSIVYPLRSAGFAGGNIDDATLRAQGGAMMLIFNREVLIWIIRIEFVAQQLFQIELQGRVAPPPPSDMPAPLPSPVVAVATPKPSSPLPSAATEMSGNRLVWEPKLNDPTAPVGVADPNATPPTSPNQLAQGSFAEDEEMSPPSSPQRAATPLTTPRSTVNSPDYGKQDRSIEWINTLNKQKYATRISFGRMHYAESLYLHPHVHAKTPKVAHATARKLLTEGMAKYMGHLLVDAAYKKSVLTLISNNTTQYAEIPPIGTLFSTMDLRLLEVNTLFITSDHWGGPTLGADKLSVYAQAEMHGNCNNALMGLAWLLVAKECIDFGHFFWNRHYRMRTQIPTPKKELDIFLPEGINGLGYVDLNGVITPPTTDVPIGSSHALWDDVTSVAQLAIMLKGITGQVPLRTMPSGNAELGILADQVCTGISAGITSGLRQHTTHSEYCPAIYHTISILAQGIAIYMLREADLSDREIKNLILDVTTIKDSNQRKTFIATTLAHEIYNINERQTVLEMASKASRMTDAASTAPPSVPRK